MDRAKGSTDILDMAFISPNLAKHDIQFQIDDYLGSDHLPIEISIDTPPHRNTFTNHTKYKFDQTDREVFESTLEEALGSADFSGHLSTSDLDKYADFIIFCIMLYVITHFFSSMLQFLIYVIPFYYPFFIFVILLYLSYLSTILIYILNLVPMYHLIFILRLLYFSLSVLTQLN